MGVQIPLPQYYAGVVQLVRILDCQSKGRGFKFRRSRHLTIVRKMLKIEFLPGDSKKFSKFLKILRILILAIYAALAHSEEHCLAKAKARGA